MEELKFQHSYTALASSSLMVASSLYIGVNEGKPDSSGNAETGGMVNAPPLNCIHSSCQH